MERLLTALQRRGGNGSDRHHRASLVAYRSRKLCDRRAEVEAVAVGIGDGEFTQSPGLIDGSGVDGGVGAAGGVEAAGAEGCVALVDVVDEDAANGAEDAVAGMTGELQIGAVTDEVDDAVGHFDVFVSGPFAFEVENFGVKAQGALQIGGLDYGDDSHVGLQTAGRQDNSVVAGARDSQGEEHPIPRTHVRGNFLEAESFHRAPKAWLDTVRPLRMGGKAAELRR